MAFRDKPDKPIKTNYAPTDRGSSAFVQPGEWVVPMRERKDGSIEVAEDYEQAPKEAGR